ncbi:Cof-type HAD-IIB family hydrolase [Irregularibacter muris]|uniref:Cof-type HAD-IIB family hydrolase n=1 Tax=Irregularibacter muris TaxID=1796619 RepID=A0AAE3HDW2_9FIRM|nr:Cof-type HAD-IIB family hydrolase [Irregularibacter muris]MCR1897607.1 Cof-type HAD-IIB family hydrolase [Irregularibacter muris]
MRYKMVAIDMDGTLLTTHKQVTPKTKKALLDAQKQGAKIVITTGRIYTSALLYAQYIGLKTPIIACNGAIIQQVGKEKTFETFPIHKKTIIEGAEICKDIGADYFFFTQNKIYVGQKLEFFRSYLLKETQVDPTKHISIHSIDSTSMICDIQEEILKLSIWSQNKDIIKEALYRIHQMDNAFVTSSSPRNIELTHKNATKGNAIKTLAEYYHIPMNQVIAIGDSYNDITMIKQAGLGVAMDNGRKEVKEVADEITLSNDQEGVAAILEKYILDH